MKTRTPALAAHHSQGSTTRAYCWKVTRRDNAVFGFTSVDTDIEVDGLLYEAATGFSPSAIAQNSDLSVANLEVVGALDSATITEIDLLAGVWDGADVEVFEVNFRDLSAGKMILITGKLGDVSSGRVAFTAELRSLTQQLQQPVGEVYTAACVADLGDARCGINLAALAVSGTVTGVVSRRNFSTALAQASDYFGGGLVTWTTGANAGLSLEVRDFSAGAFVLVQQMPFDIVAGDAFSAVPGCRKRWDADCRDKFSNIINHRGFPFLPQNDVVVGQAGTAVVDAA